MKQLKKLQDKIAKLEEKKKDVLNRQINRKAGWVYVISNPSLNNMVKIGVTRRLSPMDRVNKVNKQKEFFTVTLDMVKEEVLKHNPTATFIDNVVVDEYELSKEMA